MTKQKSLTATHHKKRHGQHRKHSHSYRKVYWPYLPMLGMLFFVLSIGMFQKQPLGSVLGASNGINDQALLSQTNAQREKNDAPALTRNNELAKAAQAKAQDMRDRNYWSHQTPDGSQPWSFIEETNYAYQKAGENLAYGFLSSNGTVSGWMQSQSHRENMLDNSYSEVGFGIAEAQDYLGKGRETIVVAFYAAPEKSAQSGLLGSESRFSTALLSGTGSASVPLASVFANGQTWTTLMIGALVGGLTAFMIVRHSLRLKRLAVSGEQFVMHHPVLDLSVTMLIAVGALLLQSAGHIG